METNINNINYNAYRPILVERWKDEFSKEVPAAKDKAYEIAEGVYDSLEAVGAGLRETTSTLETLAGLGVDSLGIVELALELEDKFDVNIPDSAIDPDAGEKISLLYVLKAVYNILQEKK